MTPTVRTAGAPVEGARAAAILLHGRGGSAADMLALARALSAGAGPPAVGGIAWLAPQAPGRTWYPHGFMEPLERNRPALDDALATVGHLSRGLEEEGMDASRQVLLGFSQGACLALEYAARNARRYGGVAALSGGLIGPRGTPRDYPGSLEGTPAFFGCSDRDPHVPVERVEESARVLERLGARVEKRIYPRMGHTVNEDELRWVRRILAAAASPEEGAPA